MKKHLLYLQIAFLCSEIYGESVTTTTVVNGEGLTYEPIPFYPNLLNMAQAAITNCYVDDNKSEPVLITDAGLRGLLNGERADVPRNTKCLRYCIMRKNQLFNDEDIFNLNNMKNFFKNLNIEKIDDKALVDIIESCNEDAMKENDRCERAHKASVCILEHLNDE